MDDFLTVEEAASRLKVKPYTVRKWITQKKLRAYKVGRDYRIRLTDFEKFLEERRTDQKD